MVAKTLRDLRVTPKPLVVCLPRNLVTMRNLHLPSQDPAETAEMIDLNIVRLVPYRKEEVLSGHQVVGADEVGYSRVLLVIAHREIVKRQMNILASAGVSADQVYVSTHGAWSWVLARHQQDLQPQALYLLLDVDTACTDFVIFSKERVLFSRSIAVELAHLADDAGRTKLLSEIRQSLDLFQSEELPKKPEMLFLAGALEGRRELLVRAVGPLGLSVVMVEDPEAGQGRGGPPPASTSEARASMTAVAGSSACRK